MSATYRGEGKRVRYYNGGGTTIAGGTPVPLNAQLGVTLVDILTLCWGMLEVEGEHELAATSGDSWAVGDILYWNAGTAKLTSTAQALLAGHATRAKTGGQTTATVKLGRTVLNASIADALVANSIAGGDSSLDIAGLGAAQGGVVAVAGGTSATAGNAGGAATLAGGIPGATGAGGAASVAGGIGGATSGTGGAASVAGGAGTNGNANGGAANLLGGNAHGSGTDGVVNVGTSNTSAVNVAATSIPTNIAGPITAGVGGSTLADGSTYADAAALPAGTAPVYPTTGADDAKGVIINAADKVTGRLLLIGNGVSNKILKVYGPSGAVINGAGANAAFSSASGKGVIAVCLSGAGNTWLMW